jgi:hypothetical protein
MNLCLEVGPEFAFTSPGTYMRLLTCYTVYTGLCQENKSLHHHA